MELSLEEVNDLANKLMKFYDPNNTGQINRHYLSLLYDHIYSGFSTSMNDQESLKTMMDINRDGKVTHSDILVLCQKYFLVDQSSQPFKSPERKSH